MSAEDDPILAATTVAEYVEQVNRQYKFGLPVSQVVAVLEPLWGRAVTVELHPTELNPDEKVIYRATSSAVVSFTMGSEDETELKGNLMIDVCD